MAALGPKEAVAKLREMSTAAKVKINLSEAKMKQKMGHFLTTTKVGGEFNLDAALAALISEYGAAGQEQVREGEPAEAAFGGLPPESAKRKAEGGEGAEGEGAAEEDGKKKKKSKAKKVAEPETAIANPANEGIVSMLLELATLEQQGSKSEGDMDLNWAAISHRKAAASIKKIDWAISEADLKLMKPGKAKKVDAVGGGTLDLLYEWFKAGTCEKLENAKKGIFPKKSKKSKEEKE